MTMGWLIAHARGCDFGKLREKGFLTLYPMIDDYVFLEDKPENQKYLRKQSELGVFFLRKGGKYQTVSRKEIDQMCKQTTDRIVPKAEILVVSGFGANLEGKVIAVEGNQLHCELQGLKRVYNVVIDRQDVVLKGPD